VTTLQVEQLKSVLERAKNTGICEEAVTVSGLSLVVRSLPPEAYNDIYAELEACAEGSEYMHGHQIEHVCRAICEIEGEDLRDVEYIEVEKENPDTHELEMVKVPRHEWLKDNLMATWSREVIHTLYRKFMDAVNQATEEATKGIVFRVETETAEEKFRRLLGEAVLAGDDIPDDMREAILKEHDLLSATSEEELAKFNEDAKKFLAEQRTKMGLDEREAPKTTPAPPPSEPPPSTVPIEDLMASRTPMNQEAVQERTPITPETRVEVANKRPPLPAGIEVVDLGKKGAERAAQFAALEEAAASDGLALDEGVSPNQVYQIHQGGHVLEKRTQQGVKSPLVIDKKPTGGINKKYNPPSGGGLDPRSHKGR